MAHILRILAIFVAAVLITGCSQMVPIDGVPSTGTVERSLTKDQVKEAIEEGAHNAGWVAKDIGNDQVAATYRVRVHTVLVTIDYTEDYYRINYRNSQEMKVQCTEADHKAAKNIIVTGRQTCPGFGTPLYIHGNYAQWVSSLKTSIDQALLFVD